MSRQGREAIRRPHVEGDGLNQNEVDTGADPSSAAATPEDTPRSDEGQKRKHRKRALKSSNRVVDHRDEDDEDNGQPTKPKRDRERPRKHKKNRKKVAVAPPTEGVWDGEGTVDAGREQSEGRAQEDDLVEPDPPTDSMDLFTDTAANVSEGWVEGSPPPSPRKEGTTTRDSHGINDGMDDPVLDSLKLSKERDAVDSPRQSSFPAPQSNTRQESGMSATKSTGRAGSGRWIQSKINQLVNLSMFRAATTNDIVNSDVEGDTKENHVAQQMMSLSKKDARNVEFKVDEELQAYFRAKSADVGEELANYCSGGKKLTLIAIKEIGMDKSMLNKFIYKITKSSKTGKNVKFHRLEIDLSWNETLRSIPALPPFIHNIGLKNLKELKLPRCGLVGGDESFRNLCTELARHQDDYEMTGLESLNLRENNLGDDGAYALGPVIENSKYLKKLNLNGTKITTDGCSRLMDALLVAPDIPLTQVDFRDCTTFGDHGVALLARALAGVHSLQSVSFRNNGIECTNFLFEYPDETPAVEDSKRYPAIEMLALMVKNCTNLIELDLGKNNMSPENGIDALCDALKTNTTLRRLDLERCSIGKLTIENQLKSALIKCSASRRDDKGNVRVPLLELHIRADRLTMPAHVALVLTEHLSSWVKDTGGKNYITADGDTVKCNDFHKFATYNVKKVQVDNAKDFKVDPKKPDPGKKDKDEAVNYFADNSEDLRVLTLVHAPLESYVALSLAKQDHRYVGGANSSVKHGSQQGYLDDKLYYLDLSGHQRSNLELEISDVTRAKLAFLNMDKEEDRRGTKTNVQSTTPSETTYMQPELTIREVFNGRHSCLKELKLCNNTISELPAELLTLKSLRSIDVSANPPLKSIEHSSSAVTVLAMLWSFDKAVVGLHSEVREDVARLASAPCQLVVKWFTQHQKVIMKIWHQLMHRDDDSDDEAATNQSTRPFNGRDQRSGDHGQLDMVLKLNILDSQRQNVLHTACNIMDARLITDLVKWGVRMDVVDSQGFLPVEIIRMAKFRSAFNNWKAHYGTNPADLIPADTTPAKSAMVKLTQLSAEKEAQRLGIQDLKLLKRKMAECNMMDDYKHKVDDEINRIQIKINRKWSRVSKLEKEFASAEDDYISRLRIGSGYHNSRKFIRKRWDLVRTWAVERWRRRYGHEEDNEGNDDEAKNGDGADVMEKGHGDTASLRISVKDKAKELLRKRIAATQYQRKGLAEISHLQRWRTMLVTCSERRFIHDAARKGSYDQMLALLELYSPAEAYAKILEPDEDEWKTPLHLAAKNGNVKVLHLCLQKIRRKNEGTDDDDYGQQHDESHAAGHKKSPQHQRGWGSLIIDNGALDDKSTKKLNNIIRRWAMHNYMPKAKVQNAYKIQSWVEIMSSNTDTIDCFDQYCKTALHYAVLEGHTECVSSLVQAGSNPLAGSFNTFHSVINLEFWSIARVRSNLVENYQNAYTAALSADYFWENRDDDKMRNRYISDGWNSQTNEERTSKAEKMEEKYNKILHVLNRAKSVMTMRQHYVVYNFCSGFLPYLIYLLILTLIMPSVSNQWNGGSYYYGNKLEEYITKEPLLYTDEKFEVHFRQLNNFEDVWAFLKGPLLDGILPTTDQYGVALAGTALLYTQYQTNRLLGAVRLRQLRVKEDSCLMFQDEFNRGDFTCYGEFSVASESKEAFGPSGDESKYTYTKVDDYAVSGQNYYIWYPNGGFVVDLALGDNSAAATAITQLETDKWIDRATRAIFVEFTTYNAQVNQLAFVQLLMELPGTGGVVPSYSIYIFNPYRWRTGLQIFQVVLEFGFAAFVMLHLMSEYEEYTRLNRKYWAVGWNYWDLSMFALYAVNACLQVWIEIHWIFLDFDIANTEYLNTYAVAALSVSRRRVLAVTLLLAWLRLVKYLAILPKIGPVVEAVRSTLSNTKVVMFFVLLIILWLSISLSAYFAFGTGELGYDSFPQSMLSIIRVTQGDVDALSLQRRAPVVGSLFLLVVVIFGSIIFLNLLIAVLSEVYQKSWEENEKNWEKQVNHSLQHEFPFSRRRTGYKVMVEIGRLIHRTLRWIGRTIRRWRKWEDELEENVRIVSESTTLHVRDNDDDDSDVEQVINEGRTIVDSKAEPLHKLDQRPNMAALPNGGFVEIVFVPQGQPEVVGVDHAGQYSLITAGEILTSEDGYLQPDTHRDFHQLVDKVMLKNRKQPKLLAISDAAMHQESLKNEAMSAPKPDQTKVPVLTVGKGVKKESALGSHGTPELQMSAPVPLFPPSMYVRFCVDMSSGLETMVKEISKKDHDFLESVANKLREHAQGIEEYLKSSKISKDQDLEKMEEDMVQIAGLGDDIALHEKVISALSGMIVDEDMRQRGMNKSKKTAKGRETAKAERISPDEIPDEEALIQILESSVQDTPLQPREEWGKGKAKPPKKLLEEVKSGEAFLLRDPNGKIIRRLFVANFAVLRTNAEGRQEVLIETHNTVNNATAMYRRRYQLGAEKYKEEEGIESAVVRGCMEEFAITESDKIKIIRKEKEVIEVNPSQSFPGLHTEYLLKRMCVSVSDALPDGETFFTKEIKKDGKEFQHHHWRWYPREKWDIVVKAREVARTLEGLESIKPHVDLYLMNEYTLRNDQKMDPYTLVRQKMGTVPNLTRRRSTIKGLTSAPRPMKEPPQAPAPSQTPQESPRNPEPSGSVAGRGDIPETNARSEETTPLVRSPAKLKVGRRSKKDLPPLTEVETRLPKALENLSTDRQIGRGGSVRRRPNWTAGSPKPKAFTGDESD